MSVLVTGANGFVGAAIVRALLAEGREVKALVRITSDCRNLEALPVEVRIGDITDPASLRGALAGCRFVIHAAADYRLWTNDRTAMYRTNVDGSVHVVAAAAELGIERLVYTSSVAALGTHADGSPATEDSPVSLADMVGHYKRSKFLAEQAVRDAASRLRVPVVVVNPSTPIGPGDIKPTPTGRIIVDAATGRIPAYVDTGLNVVHVDDVARGHLLALTNGRDGERYILGGADLSLREILALVAREVGRRPPSVRLPRLPLYPAAVVAEAIARVTQREPRLTLDGLRMAAKHMYFSSHKAEVELGYHARPAEVAIHDAVAWFRSHAYI
jgi:dihydroflavonol-4-reductase